MVIIWIIIEVLFIFLFYELPPVKEEESGEEKPNVQFSKHTSKNSPSKNVPGGTSANIQEAHTPDNNESLNDFSKNRKDMLGYSQSAQVQVNIPNNGPSENSPLLPRLVVNQTAQYNTNSNNQHEEATTDGGRSCWHLTKKAGSHLMWCFSELLREEMIVLLAILFITMFSQTTTEARNCILCFAHINCFIVDAHTTPFLLNRLC